MEAGGRRIEEYDAYASLCQRCDVVWAHVDDVDDEILGAWCFQVFVCKKTLKIRLKIYVALFCLVLGINVNHVGSETWRLNYNDRVL